MSDGVKVSEMTVDTVIDGTEKIVSLDGTTSKTISTAKMAEYSIDVLAVAAAATPTTGDDIVAFRGATEKKLDLDAVVTYAVAGAWSSAGAVSPLLTGDLFLTNRAGTTGKATIDTLQTYILTGVQATVLDLSGLAVATLAGTDLFAVCQTTTGKKVTLTALETKLWADYLTYTNALDAVVTSVDADIFYVIQGGTAKKVTGTTLSTYFQTKIGAGVVAAAFDSADGTAVQATDLFILERAGDTKTLAGSVVAEYVVDVLGAKTATGAAAAGDKFVVWRAGGVENTLDIDLLATYVLAGIPTAYATDVSVLGTDTVLFTRSSTGKKATIANLAAHVLAEYDIPYSSLDFDDLAAAALTATDGFVVYQASVALYTTLANLETKLWTDFATYSAALASGSPFVATDKFYATRAGTPYSLTGTDVYTFVTTSLWDSTAASALASGNHLIIHDGVGTKKATFSQVATLVLADAQNDILDISGLEQAASIGDMDQLLLCQSGSPAYVDYGDLEEEVLSGLAARVTALDEVASIANDDEFYVLQSGVEKKVTASDLASYAAEEVSGLPWRTIDTDDYTATPTSTSVLAMSDTSLAAAGLPIRYTDSRGTFYAIITAVTANVSITIAGAPFNVANDLTAFAIGPASSVVQMDFTVASTFGNGVADLLLADNKQYVRWGRGAAYLVSFGGTHGTADTGANQPKINCKVDGDLVSTEDANNGISLSAVAGTWVDNSAVAIATANYGVARGDAIEVRCTAAGTNADAADLSVSLLFVLA